MNEGHEFAKGLLNSEEYRDNLKMRLENGLLAPALERRLWDYRFGKPEERIKLQFEGEALENKSPSELVSYIEELVALAKRLDAATPRAALTVPENEIIDVPALEKEKVEIK